MEKNSIANKKKIYIRKELMKFQSDNRITIGEIHERMADKEIEFEEQDVLEVAYDEGYYSENNSWDPHFYCILSRMVIETNDEYEKRRESIDEMIETNKKNRYENYLKLKEEFDGNKEQTDTEK